MMQTIKPRAVYVVQHTYADDDHEDTKFIGVYSTRRNAMEAVKKLRKKSGFRKYPKGFHIDRQLLDVDHWIEGFSSV